jgi:hypothetical protein
MEDLREEARDRRGGEEEGDLPADPTEEVHRRDVHYHFGVAARRRGPSPSGATPDAPPGAASGAQAARVSLTTRAVRRMGERYRHRRAPPAPARRGG